MVLPSRHGAQGGMVSNDIEEAPSITPYEEHHNWRKKELHDEVQRPLLKSGFTKAVHLCEIFIEEVNGEASASSSHCRRSRKWIWRHGKVEATELHGSACNAIIMDTRKEIFPVLCRKKKMVCHSNTFLCFPSNMWY